MSLYDCSICNGDGKSKIVILDTGESFPCEYCDGKGKLSVITPEEVLTRRFDILERRKS